MRGYHEPRRRCRRCDRSIASRQFTNHAGSDRCRADTLARVRRLLSSPGRADCALAVAYLIGLPEKEWPGRCHEIAGLLLQHGLVDDETAKLRYGHWLGPVSEACVVTSWRNAPFARHGWIEIPPDTLCLPCKTCYHMEDEHSGGSLSECEVRGCGCPCYEADANPTIIDPTRWVFEADFPYIYVGPSDHYDMGGNALRAAMRSPCPPYSASEPRSSLAVWKYDRAAHAFVMTVMFGGAPGVTEHMTRWLANAPLPELGPYAEAIYKAIVDAGWKADIPIDNFRAVLGEWAP
jgi:hypothetical protein